MAAASASANGYLTSTDWNTFNGKQPAGTYVTSVSGTSGRVTSTGGTTPAIDLASGIATAGTTGSSSLIPVVTIDTYGRVTTITTAANPQGTVTAVTATAPVASSGGTTPVISMAAASASANGYLTSTDWNTFNNKTSNLGTVTSVAALTLGTTGTDLSSTVANGTTTPVITLQVPTASAANRGALSSADWSTFNSKANTASPTFTGTVGLPAVTLAGTVAGGGNQLNNVVIGASTPLAGNFTTLSATDVTTVQAGSAATPAITTSGDTNTGIFFPAADTIAFANGGAEALRITSAGNVGIGTNSPTRRLDVSGAGVFNFTSGSIEIAEPGTVPGFVLQTSTANQRTDIRNTAGNLVFTTGTESTTERMRITDAGNVGVGTSSPVSVLDVAGTTPVLTIKDTQSKSWVVNDTVGDLDFYSTDPSGSGPRTVARVRSFADATATTVAGALSFWTSAQNAAATEKMRLTKEGNLQVPAMYGTTVTTPRNVFIDSAGNLGGISSTRASKTNIFEISDVNWLTKLSPVSFNYRKRDEDGNYTASFEPEIHYGLLAEDIEAIKPEFCIYVDGKLAGIHYDRMISPLIKLVKDLKSDFDLYKKSHP
jgi:hypothetical protein